MYFREVADGNLREKNCEVRLSIFFLWPNRFWPFFGQRLIRPNGHKKTPEGLSRPFGAFSVSQKYVRFCIVSDYYRLLCS